VSDNTKIEWTDATWNPVTGCTEVSPGCDHCYAKTFAERWRGTPGHHFENGFDLTLRPERLDQPLKWRKPRRIFVNSMSDLFHDGSHEEYRAAQVEAEARGATHYLQPWGHLYEPPHRTWSSERDPEGEYPGAIRRWGKKAAGRVLDGRTWDEFPGGAR